MKRINFGVIALVLGLTLAITGSAFKPIVQSEWGFDQATQQYYDINNLPSGSTFNCNLSTQVCTEIYDGDPNSGGTYIRDEKVDGTFVLVP